MCTVTKQVEVILARDEFPLEASRRVTLDPSGSEQFCGSDIVIRVAQHLANAIG